MLKFLLGSLLLDGVVGHPSAISGGRASCGAEFDTISRSYTVPDIGEAWYLRRISTCDSPYFWNTWTVNSLNKPLYIAAITPKIDRFTDKLQFNGILLGPGFPELNITKLKGEGYIPESLVLPNPKNTHAQDSNGNDLRLASTFPTGSLTGIFLTPPENGYTTCDFVDTNPVMKSFSDPVTGIDGKNRCMENLFLDIDYKDKLKAGKTWDSYWIYSKEFIHKGIGKHYLVTWLSQRNTQLITPATGATQKVINAAKLVNGKYEMTVGPQVWYGYADSDTMDAAYMQSTTCSCGMISVEYLEQHTERLGSPPLNSFSAALPEITCSSVAEISSSTTRTSSHCKAEHDFSVNEEVGTEWAGEFDLEIGSYTWSFYAFGGSNTFRYPDRTMRIVAAKCTTGVLNSTSGGNATSNALIPIQDGAHSIIQNSIPTGTKVPDLGTIKWDKDLLQVLEFRGDYDAPNTAEIAASAKPGEKTEYKLEVMEVGKYCLFTEHVPAEFLSTYLVKTDDSTYHFPIYSRVYSVKPTTTSSNSNNLISTSNSILKARFGGYLGMLLVILMV